MDQEKNIPFFTSAFRVQRVTGQCVEVSGRRAGGRDQAVKKREGEWERWRRQRMSGSVVALSPAYVCLYQFWTDPFCSNSL